MYFLMRWSKPISLLMGGGGGGGLPLKERISFPREQILSFKSNPQILSDTVSTLKLKNKNDFFKICQGVWKTVKCQGILRWMISGNPACRRQRCAKS